MMMIITMKVLMITIDDHGNSCGLHFIDEEASPEDPGAQREKAAYPRSRLLRGRVQTGAHKVEWQVFGETSYISDRSLSNQRVNEPPH